MSFLFDNQLTEEESDGCIFDRILDLIRVYLSLPVSLRISLVIICQSVIWDYGTF